MRRRSAVNEVSSPIDSVLKDTHHWTEDPALARSLYVSSGAVTKIRQLLETGGTIITDSMLLAGAIDRVPLRDRDVKIACYIDEIRVRTLAQQRGTTRAEVAVDYGLSQPGLKLMVIGSAPAAINRILYHREENPLLNICVLAGCNGFSGVIQAKELLIHSRMNAIVIRGKQGGMQATVDILNAAIKEASEIRI